MDDIIYDKHWLRRYQDGWRRRWQRWLNQRLPARSQVLLNQRRIFILPTRQGFLYLLVVALLFLLAVNYQNSLVLALCFLLLSIFIVCTLHTFLNLHQLQLRDAGAEPVFAGEDALFRIQLNSTSAREHISLELSWGAMNKKAQQRSAMRQPVTVDIVTQQGVTVEVPYHTQRRGWLEPGRLLLRSCYPLGLLQSWSWIDFGSRALIYPKPRTMSQRYANMTQRGSVTSRRNRMESEGELYGFRNYRYGDPLKQIAWKSLAKGQPLMVKQYRQQRRPSAWLDWYALPHLGVEQRLSVLCDQALQWTMRHWHFGLKLPGETLPLGAGDIHLQRVLKALALYQKHGQHDEQGTDHA